MIEKILQPLAEFSSFGSAPDHKANSKTGAVVKLLPELIQFLFGGLAARGVYVDGPDVFSSRPCKGIPAQHQFVIGGAGRERYE